MNIIEKRVVFVFSVIYLVGVFGFILPPLRPYFVPLTPFTILATIGTAMAFDKSLKIPQFVVLLAIGVLGYFVEYAGVKTGKIFGEYSYGSTLGWAWQNVPFLIGVNWLAIIYFSNHLASHVTLNKFVASALAASLALCYDFFLEPVAMKYDFWNWELSTVPMQNYLAWFGISFLFSLFYRTQHVFKKNSLTSSLFIIQLVFFVAIFMYLKF